MQAYIALSVHDELCIHCPDSEVTEVCKIMQDKMENTTKLSVPLQAEPIVGTRYGEVK
jgi:DNA polymerase I-like protein with 3'-5' exonuclease and polymerase domains